MMSIKQKRELSVEGQATTKTELEEKDSESILMQEVKRLEKENSELIIKNQALEKALNSSDASRDFINNISHEVRTPIQGINAIAKGLVSNWDNFDNKTNYELAAKIAQNSQRLFSIIDNILELSKLKNGKMELKFRKVNLHELITDMVDECRNLYLNEKDITIDLIYQIDKNIHLLIDEDKITQVLRNCLAYAIKFTLNGKITIEVKENNSSVVISILSKSTEPLEDNINNILSDNPTSKGSSTEIGLIVAKSIVRAHRGKLSAQNTPHRGVGFSFSLPLSQTSYVTKPISTTKFSDSTAKANIIVIDDEETCLLSMSMMLLKTNYILHKFSSPIKALEFLNENPQIIDIILLDMMMPELDGLEFLRKIKAHAQLRNIPVIMQSGIADIGQIDHALSIGVKDFIRKPYDKETLITAIENIIKSNSKV